MLEKKDSTPLSQNDREILRDRVLNLQPEVGSWVVDPRKPAGMSSGLEAVEIHFPVSGVTINFGRTPTDVEEGINGDLEDITISMPPDSDRTNVTVMQYRLRRNGIFTYESEAFHNLDDGRIVIDRENDIVRKAAPKRGPVVNSSITEENVGQLRSFIKNLERQPTDPATVLYVNRWARVGNFIVIPF